MTPAYLLETELSFLNCRRSSVGHSTGMHCEVVIHALVLQQTTTITPAPNNDAIALRHHERRFVVSQIFKRIKMKNQRPARGQRHPLIRARATQSDGSLGKPRRLHSISRYTWIRPLPLLTCYLVTYLPRGVSLRAALS